MMQMMINRAKYQELPADLQEIVKVACWQMHEDMKVEYDYGSGRTVETLRLEHGVQFLRLNREVLEGFGKAAGEMLQHMYDNGNDYMRRVWQFYFASRDNTVRFLRFNEQSFLNARTLDFAFPSRGLG